MYFIFLDVHVLNYLEINSSHDNDVNCLCVYEFCTSNVFRMEIIVR